jgi:hypothetical protein
MRGKCKNCIHFTEVQEQRGDMRFCTRNPPTVILVPRQSPLNPSQMNLSAEGAWPPVGPDHECGCFETAIGIGVPNNSPSGVVSISRKKPGRE